VESDYVEPLSASQAMQLYEELPIHEIEPALVFTDQM
jgi:hypothetical protein